MRVLRGDPVTWEAEGPHVVTIGVFDGVHRGHQHVMGLTRAAADRSGLRAGLITFDRHPLTVLAPERAPLLLTSLERRLELFEEAGLDTVGVLPFGDAVRTLSPEDFVVRIIVMGFAARRVVVGEDFRFGQGRAGNVEVLARVGTEMGFEVEPVTLLGSGGPFSSSRVRTLIAAGEVEAAAEALGRPHDVVGRAVGDPGGEGPADLPTAMVAFAADLAIPGGGIYAVRASVGARRDVAGLASIEVLPASAGGRPVVRIRPIEQARILDGDAIGVRFVSRIRDGGWHPDSAVSAAEAEGDLAAAQRVLGRRAP